jgi:hypothetical protein
MLPFGEGHKFFTSGAAAAILGGWSITPVATFQAGFPLGVSQNDNISDTFLFGGTLRPNLTDQEILAPGSITDRIKANTKDNVYYNLGAFSTSPRNQFGNAPRTLDAYSPWRNNVDLSVSKSVQTGAGTAASVRLEVLNLFNIVQWAAPASSAFGNSSFGQITNQANNMRMVQFTLRYQF